ncbi:MAG: hypothetical protein AAF546_06470, partial [Verrucomicrobiota bacterium]
MSKSKKPVIVVAAVLAGLIVLPLFILFLSKFIGDGSSVDGFEPTTISQPGSSPLADFDLRQLEDRAKELLDGGIADAVRKGDVSLDFVAELNGEMQRTQDAIAKGKTERAESLLKGIIASAEAQLNMLALADQARSLNESTYAELQRQDYLKGAFEKTYREAVETYNAGLNALNLGEFQDSIDKFELVSAILGDLEARSIQQIANLLESAEASLADDKLAAARAAYEEVLKIDSANTEATEGLVMLTAIEGIAD